MALKWILRGMVAILAVAALTLLAVQIGARRPPAPAMV
jgi:hypothetical protein